MEKIDVAGMDAKAVVYHREMTDAFGVQPVDRPHHVRGIHRMDEVSDDAVHLFPPVDLPLLIVCIYRERGIRCRHAYRFRFPDAMNDIKTRWRCPRNGPVRPGEDACDVSQPDHYLSRLDGDLRDAFL